MSKACKKALEQIHQCEIGVIKLPISLFNGIFISGITLVSKMSVVAVTTYEGNKRVNKDGLEGYKM